MSNEPRSRKKPTKMLKVLNDSARSRYRLGFAGKITMRDIDLSRFTPTDPLSAVQVLAIRKREGITQKAFAYYLNVNPKIVSEWERGEKRPSGPSLKLLSLVKAKGLDAIS